MRTIRPGSYNGHGGRVGSNLYIVFAGTCIRTQALTQLCRGDFGSNITDPFDGNSSVGLFLNPESRAQCNGTVTAYHYCYYDNTGMVVFFMVFRDNGNEYSIVEGSHQRVTRTDAQVNGFGCDVVQLNLTQQFQVQENDFIAACTVDRDDLMNRPLRVYASSENELYRLLRLRSSIGSCLSTELSTIMISDVEKVDDFALHLYADIGKYRVTHHSFPPTTCTSCYTCHTASRAVRF